MMTLGNYDRYFTSFPTSAIEKSIEKAEFGLVRLLNQLRCSNQKSSPLNLKASYYFLLTVLVPYTTLTLSHHISDKYGADLSFVVSKLKDLFGTANPMSIPCYTYIRNVLRLSIYRFLKEFPAACPSRSIPIKGKPKAVLRYGKKQKRNAAVSSSSNKI